MAEKANDEVTEEELVAARQIPMEQAQRQNLGMTMDWDEAVDGCTVYEPDGWCPHGYRGLNQIRAWMT